MKNYYLLILAIFIGMTSANAQLTSDVEMTGMLIFTKEKEPAKMTGSPYYEDDFIIGQVMEDKRKVRMLMRYNALEDMVVLRPNTTSTKEYVLPKKKSITYDFGDYTYFIDRLKTEEGELEAYFAKFYQGENSTFVGQPKADFTPARQATTGYSKDKPASIKVEMVYYISIDGKPFREVRLKEKDLEDLFDSDRMEDYLDDRKIKTEADVVAMLKFYDSI
ncbi:hypothetical protein [Christiangramia portivictoriae]|uniref:hypothetical protein n=1 Tax=Christiangramia portivictoriae TaxID=326069 RepID=UPI00041903FC|nr:hypothetical protein [Christiangramia portivictoriae]